MLPAVGSIIDTNVMSTVQANLGSTYFILMEECEVTKKKERFQLAFTITRIQNLKRCSEVNFFISKHFTEVPRKGEKCSLQNFRYFY
ncbi:hypothetical protein NPIL_206621 [Nephila pilipes]|uniref:Uncharacterized protein n=1 Tax=Nephila pilipes TaxID=299642 RepID=A0A8X6UCE2_NEPPI|nr:hypothetical protein NPIL_206621 [Nephila pilipes]